MRTHYANQLSAQDDGKEVVVAGWVHELRNMGKIAFMLVRDHSGIVQITAKKGIVDDAIMSEMNLPKESVVLVKGKVKANKEAKNGFEIVPAGITNLNPLSSEIPFEVTGKVPAEIDVRLDHRHIDLRRLESKSIFNIQSSILRSFRETLQLEGFQEIVTPIIVEAATEGGTDLFEVKYFEKKAYLTQSPQLYKQLAVIGGMDRIFMITKAMRAEKHNTVYHLNESTQMDIEMGFADHTDAIRMLKKVAAGIINNVIKWNGNDLEQLSVKLQRADPDSIKEITYREAIDALAKENEQLKFGDDLNRKDEEELCRIYGDILMVKEYPTAARAFYSMPKEGDEEVCNSFDLLYKGLEISSGAQRIHIPSMLMDALKGRGINPDEFEFYINAFRNGAPPHAGWSIGLERMTMKLTNMPNIRECSMFPRDRTRVTP